MLCLGDCIEIMKTFDGRTIDLIFADPPYFLSNDGNSIRSGKIVYSGQKDRASGG